MPKQKKPIYKEVANNISRYLHSYNYTGLIFACVFFCLSLFPSLLPRSWFFQGLVSGVSLAIGYGLGVLASYSVRWLFDRDVLIKRKGVAWWGLYIVCTAAIITFLILGEAWQNDLRTILRVQPLEQTYILRVFLLSALVGVGCVKLGRSIRKLFRWLLKKIDKLIPRRISIAISAVLVVMFVSWVISGAFVTALGTAGSFLYNKKNRSTPAGIVQPNMATRSGSPQSLIGWDTIGYQGQKFVAQGPNTDQMKSISGQPAKEQIRIYVGVNSAPTAQERAKMAVEEIRRTDAFKRKVVVIAIPTGTGWLNAEAVDALEYVNNGDTAIVAQQYSFLPSWMSFLVDKQKAQDAGKELYNAVYAEWSKLPDNNRPKLIIYGLSLGSFGGQAAFSGPGDLVHSIDGALWQGTPGDTELWKEVSRRRDSGSPEWKPVIEDGRNIRFGSTSQDISDVSGWQAQRVLYMQHGSDPIVWFNFDLPLHKPDWYSEQRAPDVSTKTVWVPFVSFFQIAADQAVGMGVPKDFGHNYETTVVKSWVVLTSPNGWSEQKSKQLQDIINDY